MICAVGSDKIIRFYDTQFIREYENKRIKVEDEIIWLGFTNDDNYLIAVDKNNMTMYDIE